MHPPLEEPKAYSQLFERTHLVVFRFLFGLLGGPREEVEDLAAETYLRAWKARSRFQGDDDAALRWLLQIARNLAIDTYRRRKSRGTAIDLDAAAEYLDLGDDTLGPEAIIASRESFRKLWQLIQELPAEQREIVVLRYILGWAVKDIGLYLNIPENTVSVKIRRILGRLRKAWEDVDR